MMEESFQGNERFELRRRIGEGGMGVVYHAFDRERGVHVALKTLPRVLPANLYHFKREFRALADIDHDNLVTLYELVADGGQWFFTMELVLGEDFLTFVRGGAAVPSLPSDAATLSDDDAWAALSSSKSRSGGGELHEWRLRSALLQLSTAVGALHDEGKLHRDLKPGNVLVTRSGRVVVLDFGLVGDVEPDEAARAEARTVVGTPEYMAPEQALGRPAGPACDWYAVGSMLFEALTGELPFEGKVMEVLHRKVHGEPPAVEGVAPGLPEDLAALCAALMRREPGARPSGEEVLERLRGAPAAPEAARSRRGRSAFVGRDGELAALTDALASVAPGAPVRIDVHGSSGMGKTTLLRRFRGSAREDQGALVVAGRCYERESVPFKAFDSAVDALSRHLTGLPEAEAAALMPRDAHALARLFPVLSRVGAVAAAPPRNEEIRDAHELRLHGFGALKELLARMGDRRPIVMVIDDLQWGDVDSVALLRFLLAPPDPPRLLLVLSYRTEERSTSAALRTLLASPLTDSVKGESLELEVGPLKQEDATRLALTLLERQDLHAGEQAAAIARESEGSPFFVRELVRSVPTAATRSVPRLSELLDGRVGALSSDARALLETVAIAARALPQALALEATGLSGPQAQRALIELRAAKLARTSGARHRDRIEAYHDRIRENVAGAIPPRELEGRHDALASALLHSAGDPEDLAFHLRGAGRGADAARYAIEAAGAAREALAFEKAARLYRLAIELGAADPGDEEELHRHLGEALVNAGRSAEAAVAFLDAAKAAPAAGALEMRRCAAEHFLRSGHVDDGLAALEEVLATVGLALPKTVGRAMVGLVVRRAQLKAMGYRIELRPSSDISATELSRLDACWTAASGLAMVDFIRAVHVQAIHTILALRAGDPSRVVRAMAFEAPILASSGRRGAELAEGLLEQARRIAEDLDDPRASALYDLSTGFSALQVGAWKHSLHHLDRAEVTFRGKCTGAAWELDTARISAYWALAYLGEVGELARRVGVHRREVGDRGDLFEWTNLAVGLPNLAWLVRDDPAGALAAAEDAIGRWTRRGFTMQHLFFAVAKAHIELYRGDGEAALATVEGTWAEMTGAQLLRNQLLKVTMYELRGRARLAKAMAEGSSHRPELLGRAADDGRRIRAEERGWAAGLGALLEGQAAAAAGDVERALPLLEGAAKELDAADMALHAAGARYVMGRLRGGFSGAGTAAERLEMLSRQGVADPKRLLSLVVPAALL